MTPVLATERERREENQRLFPACFVPCRTCPRGDAVCVLCLGTRRITRGTQRLLSSDQRSKP